jgi:rubrerythrin
VIGQLGVDPLDVPDLPALAEVASEDAAPIKRRWRERRSVAPIQALNFTGSVGVLANTVTMKPTQWLWRNHLAMGMLSMLDGDPENGKSTIVADAAGRITTGRPWPDGTPCAKGGVILVGAEDSLEQVLVPRMVAAGADLSQILTISMISDGEGGTRMPSLPEDVQMFKATIQRMDARLLVLDPVMPYISLALNANADKDVRQALTPLVDMLATTNCACWALRHLSKNDKVANAIYRGLGSIAFNGVARSGMTVAKDKEDAGAFVFMVHMNNVGVKPRARRYRIEGVDLGKGIETSRIVWGEESDHSADEMLTAFGRLEKKAESAEDFLSRLLADGPVESEIVFENGKAAGFGRSTLFSAKKKRDIRARKSAFSGGWAWELPAEVVAREESTHPAAPSASRIQNGEASTTTSFKLLDSSETEASKGSQSEESRLFACPGCGTPCVSTGDGLVCPRCAAV